MAMEGGPASRRTFPWSDGRCTGGGVRARPGPRAVTSRSDGASHGSARTRDRSAGAGCCLDAMTKILVVGPHPDDQELGMGASVAKLASHGHDVLLLDITDGEPTPHGDPETRAEEARKAADILGVTRRQLDMPNRMVEHSIQSRHAVASVIREFGAEIIFTPYYEDAHPDHRAVTRIVEDARFDAKLTKIDLPGEPIYPRWLFYYYATHLRWVANPSFCLDVTGFEQDEKRIDPRVRDAVRDPREEPARRRVGRLDARLLRLAHRREVRRAVFHEGADRPGRVQRPRDVASVNRPAFRAQARAGRSSRAPGRGRSLSPPRSPPTRRRARPR